MQSSRPAGSNELAVLMELRLAFGPGTRLWANSSREDLCYEWLYFKGRQSAADLRDFARTLIARECTGLADRKSLCEIRRRVAAVLRAHQIKTSAKSAVARPITPVAMANQAASRCDQTAGAAPPGKREPVSLASSGSRQPEECRADSPGIGATLRG